MGSVSIAFILLFLIGRLIIETEDFSWIVLLSVYGVDSVLTIIHRLMPVSYTHLDVYKRQRYPNIIADVEKIEKLLPEYCYDFESKKIKPDFINGKMFDC